MTTNKRTAAIGGVVFGLLLATAGGHASTGNQSVLTFSGAVALPNGPIAAGTYSFEVVNPGSSGNLVSVRSNGRVCYLGFTHRIERPRDEHAHRFVSFGESHVGVAPPILAWYPTGDAHGYEFIYGSR
jgi:hypothetical protein